MRTEDCGMQGKKFPLPFGEGTGVRGKSEIRTPHPNGFTLVEIVITIVLVGILAGIAAMIILQGVRAYSDEQSRSDVHYQARLATERMVREIRLMRSRTAADIPTMSVATLMYTDINGVQMGFRLNGGAGAVERTENNGTTWQALAINITAPGGNIFTYFDSAGAVTASQADLWFVQMEFTATQGSESVTMRTAVHPRNF